MLAMALVFVLLLGEIDLSAGVTSGMTMALFIVLVNVHGVPWILALAAAFAVGILTGTFIGFFVARVGIPSFVVTLGLFLGYQGITLWIIGAGGLYRVQIPEISAIQNANMPVWAGWVMLAVILAVSAATSFWDRARRRRAGVPNRTITLVWIKLGVDRRHRRRRGRDPQPQPRPVGRGRRGRADRRAVRARHPLDRHVRARPHEVRPLPLRHRRQRRGRTPLRASRSC